MLRKVYSLPQSRGVGRCQAGTSYCGSSRSWLGSSRSEKGRTEWPGHRVHSGESTDRRVLRKERHRWLQPHILQLLGPMEKCHCMEWHTTAPLGICRWMTKNSPDNSPSEYSVDWTTWRTVGPLGYQQDPELGLAKVLLAPGKTQCWEVVPAVQHLCSQLRSPNWESGAKASVQH
jgi:hypothetical protein